MKNKSFSKLRITLAGQILYYLFPIRKEIVLNNISKVFHNILTQRDQTRLVKSFYSHLATTLKEMVFMSFLSTKRLNNLVEVRGVEHLLAAKNQGKGVLILYGHLGNFELSAIIFEQLTPKVGQFNMIRRPQRWKWLEHKIFAQFKNRNINIINKSGAALKINRALLQQEVIIYPMDQHTNIDNKEGIVVDFMGIKAGTSRGLAFFANKHKSPVVTLSNYRMQNGKHLFEFHPALSWEEHPGKESAIYKNTLNYNQTLETMILKHPEQWWWVHRRWKV